MKENLLTTEHIMERRYSIGDDLYGNKKYHIGTKNQKRIIPG